MRLTIEIIAAALFGLHQRHQRGLRCRRQGGSQRRRPQLRVQRREKCFARGALRGDPPPMRRKILRQLLRRQDAVGDVRQRKRFLYSGCD
jgi:hypothetical protein